MSPVKSDGIDRLLPEQRLWTRAEYDRLTELGLFEDERLELIEGRIVRKVSHKSQHATGIRLADKALQTAFPTGYEIRAQLPLALGEYSEPEPDVAVVHGSTRDYADKHPSTALLVVEVADSSLNVDRKIKAGLYARCGIQEYWIVNLVDRVLEVYREPVAQAEQPLGFHYGRIATLMPDQSITPLAAPQAVLRVTDLLP